jgi:hypothetical protein
METARKIINSTVEAFPVAAVVDRANLTVATEGSFSAHSPARALQSQVHAAYDATVTGKWSSRRRAAILVAMGVMGWAAVGGAIFAVTR